MQKQVYICDNCQKVIGNIAHISLGLNKGLSGIAMPPEGDIDSVILSSYAGHPVWRLERLPSAFLHFHFGCIEKYFTKKADKLLKPKK